MQHVIVCVSHMIFLWEYVQVKLRVPTLTPPIMPQMKHTLHHAFHVLGPNLTVYSSTHIFNPSSYLHLNLPSASLFN